MSFDVYNIIIIKVFWKVENAYARYHIVDGKIIIKLHRRKHV